MAGPIAATGAISNPTRYGALTMGGEEFTGLWRQRSPYRDAATAYLMKKFYQGSRFDSIWDGLNREITALLTDGRRPGSSIYNGLSFQPVLSYYSFKYVQNANEVIRVMVDTAFKVQDGTAGGQIDVFTKGAGAGKTRFLGLGPTLYMSDGVEIKKWMQSSAIWGASTVANIADIQIIKKQRAGVGPFVYFLIVSLTAAAPVLASGTVVSFAGLTGFSALNGQQLIPNSAHTNSLYNILLTSGQLAFVYGTALYPFTAETGTLTAGTAIPPGTIIVDSNSNLQMALGGITMNVIETASDGTHVSIYFDPLTVTNQFANLQNVQVTFAGLTTATFLNGNTYPAAVISSTLGFMQVNTAQAAYNITADTGTGTTGNGATGATPPAWSVTQYGVTPDGAGQQWKCYGPNVQGVGLPAPSTAPTLTPVNGTRWWQANTVLPLYYSILDSNQNVEVVFNYITGAGGVYKTGRGYPNWTPETLTATNPQTIDGTIVWQNMGKIQTWTAVTTYATFAVILDSNQNLQFVSNGGGGASGAAAPVWNAAVGGTTTDGALTWRNIGPGVVLTTDTIQYAFSTHAVDGSISTASPVATILGPILGPSNTLTNGVFPLIQIQGTFVPDKQIDQIYIWRTPQGESTLVFEDAIPADPFPTGAFTYEELGIPDISSAGGGALDPFIPAPIAHQNDPPPSNLTGPAYHMQRVWMFAGNVLKYSGGPDTISGNGNTAWPPLNSFTYQARIVRVHPITVQNGALLVFTTSGIKIVLGTGTQTNPFYSTSYCEKVNLASYDAFDILGTEIFMMESNLKVSSIRVEYPFDPQSGYSEVGFPIGDQFKNVTTGGFAAPLFSPASTFLSWNIQSSGETAMYVADGAIGWFRMAAVNPPESGLIWSPIAAIIPGTSAVQSIETSPGAFNLLIGPQTAGPILMRDTTGSVWDDNGTAYPSWDAKGVNLLCSTGQWAEVAHISAKSKAVGARPIVSVLLGEIAPSVQRPWNVLDVTSPDPADTPRSLSVYSDRYGLAQNGVADTSDCILTKFDYGSQAFGDQLLDWGIYATSEDERKEEVQKG